MKKRYEKQTKRIFYALIAIFTILLAFFITPIEQEVKRKFFTYMLILALAFFILGGVLIYTTIKSKLPKKHKVFLYMTGGAAAGFLASVLLHNLIYGLILTLKGGVWEGDEAVFFIIATIVCPIVFIVGMIGSLVMYFRARK